jgi:periplasmic protein TonB
MLDQLVESKSTMGALSFLITLFTFLMASALVILLFGWTYSLFGHDYSMGGDELSLTSLVAPVPVEDEPPPPEKKQEQKQPDVDVRKDLIQNIMSSPKIPPEISTAKNNIPQMRNDRITKLGDTNSNTGAQVDPSQARSTDTGGTGGLSTGTGNDTTGGDTGAPPPPPKPTVKPVPKTISGGVLNGKATSLPKPAYPAAARAIHAGGSVSVQVLIDESGRVISATAAGGHPLLQAAAVAAARGARFSPTLLSGQPVKVSGVITYNFVP